MLICLAFLGIIGAERSLKLQMVPFVITFQFMLDPWAFCRNGLTQYSQAPLFPKTSMKTRTLTPEVSQKEDDVNNSRLFSKQLSLKQSSVFHKC